MVPYIKITREKPHLTFFFAILFLAKLDSGGKIIDLSDLTPWVMIVGFTIIDLLLFENSNLIM